MGIHKQLPLEKERLACHLTPIVMLDSHTSSHQFLQSHHLHPTKENFFPFFFPFSHSCPPCKGFSTQIHSRPTVCKSFPLHTPPPAHTHQIIHATPHPKGCRHLQAVFVTLFLYLSGFTFHPGNKDVTLPSNKFITINFHS